MQTPTSRSNKLLLLGFLFNMLSVMQAQALETLSYEVITSKDHDTRLFTQGLIVHGDTMIESSGLYNKSFVRIYHTDTGDILKQKALPADIFAEGLTLMANQLYLLTWRKGILFVLDPDTLSIAKTLHYQGQGWGITHSNKLLYTSDGSHVISARDPETFAVIKRLAVKHPQHGRLNSLNELEYARELIWANRWQTNWIYAINPNNGELVGELDLTELVPSLFQNNRQQVLNGIAYDPKQDAFWVTGKNWPVRYLIRIHTKAETAAATKPASGP